MGDKSNDKLRDALRMLRRRERLSQGQLASRIGVHVNTVCRAERCPQRATLGLLQSIILACGEPRWWRVLGYAYKQQQVVSAVRKTPNAANEVA